MPNSGFRPHVFVTLCSIALAIAAVATPALAAPFDKSQLVRSKDQRALSAPGSFTNGILTVDVDGDGHFSIRTGASHPNPGQQVLYPVGTSYITLRDATSLQMFTPCFTTNPGLSGYSSANMCVTAPFVEPVGDTGYRVTYRMPNWKVVQDVRINGTTLADTNVSQAVTVTNMGETTRAFGLRSMWDWMIAGNDASLFRERIPNTAFTGTFTSYDEPAFQLFEEVNNIESPLFSVFGTVGGGTLYPAPTPPDHFRYSSWGESYSSAWDFSNSGGYSDSSTVYYWGFRDPIPLGAEQSKTYIQYVTTQLSAVAPPVASVMLSATSLDFGDVAVRSASAEQSVTLTVGGTVAYQINGMGSSALCLAGTFCAGGDFTCTTDCFLAPDSYSPGGSCRVRATFRPSEPGIHTGSIYICDNAAGNPRSITLTGRGVDVPTLQISPNGVDFGSVRAGEASAVQSFVIFNPGASPVAVSLAATGSFRVVATTCAAALAGGERCGADVVFEPTHGGRTNGALNAGSARVDLFGTGLQEAVAELTGTGDFGTFILGDPAPTLEVTLTNTGNTNLALSSVEASAPFKVVSRCPLDLAPRQSCTLQLGFEVSRVDDYAGFLTVWSNSARGPASLSLALKVQPMRVALIRVSPTAIGFGNLQAGAASPAQRVTVRNDGSAPAALTGVAVSAGFVVEGNSCGASLAAQASCQLEISFHPSGVGRVAGQLLVNSNAAGSPHAVDLQGTGCVLFASASNRLRMRPNCGP